MRKNWWNKQVVGFLLGIIVPFVTSVLIFKFRYSGSGMYTDFLIQLFEWGSLGKLLSLCVLPNLFFFFIAIKKEWNHGARGVLSATMVFGVIAVILFMAQ